MQITDEALEASVELSDRYITGRCLPDKAIDVVDEAGARVRLKAMTRPPDLKELDEQIERLNQDKEEAVANQDFERAAALARLRPTSSRRRRRPSPANGASGPRKSTAPSTKKSSREVVSKMTGMPLTRLELRGNDPACSGWKTTFTKKVISARIRGDQARSARRFASSRAGLKDPKRPIGSFIFAGPTGVGKTLLAKALADFMFGDSDALIQIDMSEYMEKHNVSRLIGAPPGYVGYEEGGQLTEKIRRRPYAVVLLDEIEKAHPDVYNTLLQIMEEGRLTDSFGRNVDFKNTIIIMTTNAGAEVTSYSNIFGFDRGRDEVGSYEQMKERLKVAIEKYFRPEFLNRLDDVIVFHALNKDDLKKIVDIELSKIRARMSERGLELVLNDQAKDFLIFKGYNPDYGARPLRRAIENLIENPLAEEILRSAFKGKDLVNVSVTGQDETKRLKFEATTKREQEELQAAAALVAVGSESETPATAAAGD